MKLFIEGRGEPLRITAARRDTPVSGKVAVVGSTRGSTFFLLTARGTLYTNGRLGAREGRISDRSLTREEVGALCLLGVLAPGEVRSISVRRDLAETNLDVADLMSEIRDIETRTGVALSKNVTDALEKGLRRRAAAGHTRRRR